MHIAKEEKRKNGEKIEQVSNQEIKKLDELRDRYDVMCNQTKSHNANSKNHIHDSWMIQTKLQNVNSTNHSSHEDQPQVI